MPTILKGAIIMAQRVDSLIALENADIGFLNFSGEPDRFNKDGGKRSFCVFLENDFGHRLREQGWNVRWLPPRDDEEEERAYLQVAVAFRFPPKIVLIAGGKKTYLNEMTVGLLDHIGIESVDVVIRPYNYDVNGRVGVKAYLKTMYVVAEHDDFEHKYADYPDRNEEVPF